MKTDSIRLSNMVFQCHIGTESIERGTKQPISVTVDLFMDLERAGNTNNIIDTINYGHVYETLHRAVEAGEYNLLEGLAADIARTILFRFRLDKVRVLATKRPNDLKKNIDSVTVDIMRHQTHQFIG